MHVIHVVRVHAHVHVPFQSGIGYIKHFLRFHDGEILWPLELMECRCQFLSGDEVLLLLNDLHIAIRRVVERAETLHGHPLIEEEQNVELTQLTARPCTHPL